MDTTVLKIASHGAPELATKILKWAKHRESDGNLTQLQQSALAAYRTGQVYDISESSTVGVKEMLQAYFLFFDKIYFGGYLEGRCGLRVPEWSSFSHRTFGRDALGVTSLIAFWFPPWKIRKIWCCIHVFDLPYSCDHEDRLWLIGTLLHEMVHAFLDIYSCTGCRFEFQNVGISGHATSFQDAAYAIEMASCDPDFLNLHVDLNILYSLKDELEAMAMGPPRDATKWRFDIQEIEKYLDAQQNIDNEAVGFGETALEVFRRVRVHNSCFLS
jgi:hypothetical protein